MPLSIDNGETCVNGGGLGENIGDLGGEPRIPCLQAFAERQEAGD